MTGLRRSTVLEAADAFAAWVRFRRRADQVPGVQASILYRDELLLSMACGLADVERGAPMTTTHRFRVASHSKTFTATAIMQLVERGKVRLDDRLGELVPELADAAVSPVTIRELLGHAGGLVRDGSDGDFWQLSRRFPTLNELLDLAGDADSKVLSRSERFKYSNVGFALLGQVIEHVTGSTYSDHVRHAVIDPLGLKRTTPELDHVEDHATGYSSLAYCDKRIPIDHITTGAMAAATGFSSTADDLVRYASAHFAEDRRLLSGQSHRLMQRDEWDVGDETQYGLGFAVAEVAGRRVVGHGGGFPGFITRTWFDPVEEVAVSVLTNAIDGPALGYAAGALRFLQLADTATPDPAGESIDLARFCGRYATLWGVTDLVVLGGRLHEIPLGVPDPGATPIVFDVVDDSTLRVASASGYHSPGERYRFRFDDHGAVQSFRGSSGSTSKPLHVFAGEVFDRSRVRLGGA